VKVGLMGSRAAVYGGECRVERQSSIAAGVGCRV